MQDSLKEHIDNNTEEFELYPFDSTKGWSEIVDELVPPKKRKNYWPFGIAASLAIIFISAVMVASITADRNPDELAEMEGFYQEAIDEKISLVKNQIGDDRILKDLEAMDEAFMELKADLSENVDNAEVVTAMMENYRLKLQILEEILNELEKEQ